MKIRAALSVAVLAAAVIAVSSPANASEDPRPDADTTGVQEEVEYIPVEPLDVVPRDVANAGSWNLTADA